MLVPGIRLLLAVAYPFLAHAASLRTSSVLAACALAVIVLMLLVEGLAQRRLAAWLACPLLLLALAWLAQSRFAMVPLLLVPVGFIAMVGWVFARTLRSGSVPLITRIVAALEQRPAPELEPDLLRYTHGLTVAWTLVLAAMAACNLTLAAIAVPRGLLATLGVVSPITVTEVQWSLFANFFDYGVVGSFFLLEFAYRKRRFPGRYRNFAEFAKRLAGLGPAFWRDIFR